MSLDIRIFLLHLTADGTDQITGSLHFAAPDPDTREFQSSTQFGRQPVSCLVCIIAFAKNSAANTPLARSSVNRNPYRHEPPDARADHATMRV